MKITIEVLNLRELHEVLASVDKHRVGACILFGSIGIFAVLVWHAFH